jgi:hypothetical protein
MSVSTTCHCGRPLHYADEVARAMIEALIQRHGAFVPVTVGMRTWRVPRHYIALHGLAASEVARLGFEEITEGDAG